MKKTKIIIICLILSFTSLYSYSQNRVIRGIVTDKNTGEKLPGVNVIEMNENDRVINGTITDFNGEYIIKIQPNSKTLKYSFIGYKSIDIEIGSKTFIDVLLVEESLGIEEVTVKAERIQTNGFMPVSIRKSSASISKIDLKEMEELGNTSLEEAMAGKLSGLDISQSSGDPGSSISIQIRGASSINGKNEPLILINGIVYETEIDDDFEFSAANADDFGGLVDIAPEDIESIEIYKDAAATALYGPKAANGVLAINTKKGRKGPATISYSLKRTWQQYPEPIPLLNGPDYVLMQLDAQYNRSMNLTGTPPDLSGDDFIPILYKPRRDYRYAWEHSQETDWIDAVTQPGKKLDHNFSISGGGDKASYRLSLGYLNSEGTSQGTGFDRFSTRLTLDYELSNRLRFDAEFSLSNSEKLTQKNEGTMLDHAYKKAPNMSIYEMLGPDSVSDEYFAAFYDETDGQDTIQNYQGSGDEWINPIAQISDGLNLSESNRIRTKLGLQYQLIPERLKMYSYIAYDINNKDERIFNPQSATGVIDLEEEYNFSSHTDQEKYSIHHTTKFIYTQNFRETHDFIAVASYSVQASNTISQEGKSERSPSILLKNHTSPSPISSLDSDLSRYREVGYIFNLRYSYKDKYVINPSFRYDGSSLYGLGNKWGLRPIISVAYFISEEPFLRGLEKINDIKFRASYGEIGKNPGNMLETFSLYNGQTDGSYKYMDINGVGPSNIQLFNIKWELIKKYNVGLDIYCFDNRLSANIEYYTDITEGALQKNYAIPASTGYESLKYYNDGIIQNSGFEFMTNATVVKKKKISLDLDFNFSVNQNKIIEAPLNKTADDADMLKNGEYTSLIVTGGGVHAYYGYVFDGVFPTNEDAIAKNIDGEDLVDAKGNPLYLRFENAGGYIFKGGDAMYRDINYDGLINELDIVQLGKPYPDFHGGFGFKVLLYKSLSFRAGFHYKVGHDIVNETKMDLENMYKKNNQATSVNRRWRENGDITEMPRALYDYGFNYLGSSRYVEDASFLKLRSFTISYRLPKKLLKQIFIKDWNVFFSSYNLYTWTNYTGQNPEVNVASKDATYIGKDKSQTPPPLEFVGGMSFKF